MKSPTSHDPSHSEHPESPRRGRLAAIVPVGVFLSVLAVGLAGFVFLARDQKAGAALGPQAVSTPSPASLLAPTDLVQLPARRIANGTLPLSVTLSAPPSQSSPMPTLEPKVAGSWTIVGDSEVFTPVSTLEPCSSYTLTVWADTTATGHAPLGRRRTSRAERRLPADLRACSRRSLAWDIWRRRFTRVHLPRRPGAQTRREAAVHAFHPSPRRARCPTPPTPPRADGPAR